MAKALIRFTTEGERGGGREEEREGERVWWGGVRSEGVKEGGGGRGEGRGERGEGEREGEICVACLERSVCV